MKENPTNYDDCLERDDNRPATLSSFLGVEEEVTDELWKKYWKGMPAFEQEKDLPYKSLTVHFRNEEDYREFAELINQKHLNERSKSTWFPRKDIEKVSLKRWVVEND